MAAMGWRRFAVFLLMTLLVLPVLSGGLLLGLLRLPATQQWLRERLAANGRFEVDGLSVAWPLSLHADRLRIVDREGAWLSITDVFVDCSPGELWRRTFLVHRLSAERMVVIRRPLVGGGGSGGLPWLPVKIAVQRLSVAALSVDRRVFGQAAEASLAAAMDLDGNRLAVAGRLTGQLAGDSSTLGLAALGSANLASGTIDLGRLILTRDADRLLAEGRLEGWGGRLAFLFSAETGDASRLAPGFAGRAMLRGAVGGSLEQPRLSASMTATPGQNGIGTFLGRAPRLSLSLALSRPSGVALAWLHLVGQQATLTAGGRLGGTLLVGACGRIAEFAAVSDGPVHGPAEATALAVGPLGDPFIGLRGEATVQFANFPLSAQWQAVVGKLRQQPAGELRLEVSVAGRSAHGAAAFRWGEVAHLDDIIVRSGDGMLAGAIAWRRGTTQLEGYLRGSVPDLAEWSALAGGTLGGSLGFDLALVPSGRHELIVRGAGLRWGGLSAAALAGRAALSEPFGRPALAADLTITHPMLGRLRLDRLRAEASGPLDDLAVGLAGDGFRASGRARPGAYRLSALSFDLGKVAIRLTSPADLTAEAAGWRLQGLTLAMPGGRLSLAGSLVDGHPGVTEGELSVRLDCHGDLGRIAELLPIGDQSVSGTVTADLRLGGTTGSPTLAGRLAVSGGGYRNFDSGTVLTGITLAAEADDIHRIRVAGHGGDGRKGSFTVEGGGDLVSGEASLKATLDHLAAVRLDLFRGDVTGDLGVTRSGGQAALSGQLTLSGGAVDLDQLAPASIVPLPVFEVNIPPSAAVPPANPGAPNTPGIAMELSLDLAVVDAQVRGKGLDSLWKGNLHLAGPLPGGGAAAPAVIGQLTVVRGSYTLFGVPLQLSGGTVAFDGEQPPDPRIDATATGQTSGTTVEVRLTGTLKKPDFAFTSDPPMPKDEVLAHLLFGNSAGQLSVMQQIALAHAAATQLTGEGTGFDPLDKLRGFFGLDMLQAGGDMSSPLAAPGMANLAATTGSQQFAAATSGSTARSSSPSLSAGKYIGSRTYLRVDQGTSGGRVSVEADLGHGFAIDSRLGEGTGEAVGLSWKRDY